MSNSAETIVTVPAELVEAVRTGLYIEESAATDQLRRNPLTGGQQPDPARYRRVDLARRLLAVIGRERPATPAAVQVNLETYRLPLLAALHGKLEADARALGKPNASRSAQERTRAIARLDALAEYISNIEAIGGARADADRQLEEQLQTQIESALAALGYDESRGDWWRVTYDGGEDGWGIKSVINGEDKNFDVTTDGYSLP